MQSRIADDSGDHALDHLSEARFIEAMELFGEAREAFIQGLDPAVADKVRALSAEFDRFDRMVEDQAATVKNAAPGLSSLSMTQDVFAGPGLLPSPGERVGPYTVLRKIGQGGMGTVFLARQENPTREVALKIVPKKQVSKHFLARFESEYQALALMSHHHIARLFDAGATPDGNAYFCMEYIDGEPITDYCRRHNLSVARRLELFLQVCSGMQHAHQKAIVHRDLKPSNILVYSDDGRAVAKIIDFGLAKGLANPLSEKTLHTQAGALAGTPAYMSPEQLMGNREQVDTRGDIYALGVILYEMLAQCHPFDLEALRKLPLDEALRHLRLEEPKPPSQQLKRAGKPGIPSDLDHITLKAMGKQLRHRYPSVHALREDIDHFLNFRPVSARSRSKLDVFAKFVRRNRIFIGASAMALTALIVGLAVAVGSSIEANRAREETQATLTFLQEMLAAPNPSVSGREVKVVDLLVDAESRLRREQDQREHPELETVLRVTLGNTYFGLGMYEDAEKHLRRALALHEAQLGTNHPETLRTNYYLARVLRRGDQLEESARRFEDTWKAQQRSLGALHPRTLQTQAGLAMTQRLLGRRGRSEELFRDVLARQREVLGAHHRDTLVSLVGLGNICFQNNKLDEAADCYREALRIQVETLGNEAPQTLASRHALANCLIAGGAYDQAEILLRQTVDLREKVLGESHSETNRSRYNLARALFAQRRYEEAAALFERVLSDSLKGMGEDHFYTLRVANRLCSTWRRIGLSDAAGHLAADLVPEQFSQNEIVDRDMLRLLQNLADIRLEQGRHAEALVLFERFLAHDDRRDLNLVSVYHALALCHEGLTHVTAAEDFFCRALDVGMALDSEDERTRAAAANYARFLEAHPPVRQ